MVCMRGRECFQINLNIWVSFPFDKKTRKINWKKNTKYQMIFATNLKWWSAGIDATVVRFFSCCESQHVICSLEFQPTRWIDSNRREKNHNDFDNFFFLLSCQMRRCSQYFFFFFFFFLSLGLLSSLSFLDL